MRKQELHIAAFGAGRMGRGIGICFALAGWQISLIDSRLREDWATYKVGVEKEIAQTLALLVDLDLLPAGSEAVIKDRISLLPHNDGLASLSKCELIFEAVPETEAAKKEALRKLDLVLSEATIVASTTSTFLADLVASWSTRPEYVLNAHFLNPAFLVPLIEVSPHQGTRPEVIETVKQALEDIGKVPVLCKASPGYIVPRIQALAMNEAARLVEEGVASAEDVDKAVRYGFGLRFAALGLLEFIDWGGLDILYYASGYLEKEMQNARFATPDIIVDKMGKGALGMGAGVGMYDWRTRDQEAFKREKLRKFVELLNMNGALKPPVL